MIILALEKDLFFAVKMRDTLRHHGMEVKTVRTLAAFEQGLQAAGGEQDERPALVIVNTATTGVDWEDRDQGGASRRLPGAGVRFAYGPGGARQSDRSGSAARRSKLEVYQRYAGTGEANDKRAGIEAIESAE